MPHNNKQVFLTKNPTRWQRFKWASRFLIFLIFLVFVVIGLALWKLYTPDLPQLKQESDNFKAILNPDKHALMQETRINKEYQGFRKYINAKGKGKKIRYVTKSDSLHDIASPIRAAFYVAWDLQAYFSLKNNISNLNMIFPEWIFIDPVGDTAYINMDRRGFDLIKNSEVRVVPVLSNFFKNDFDGNTVHRILHDPKKKERLINDVIKFLKVNDFDGVNIDLEELKEDNNEPFTTFVKELSEAMHKVGLIVTQDVSPYNQDYDLKELSKYNDFMVLMAYDQYMRGGIPGPISGQKWIEGAVDHAVKSVPPEKIILAIAGYGYDWPKGSVASTVSYEEALSTADREDAVVDFDNDNYNLNYKYKDDNGIEHTVYFTDAATNFNTLRFAVEYGLAGVTLWRLGSEDSRLWKFYNEDVSLAALDTFNFSIFNYVEESNDVDYIGEGEILDVLATPKPGLIKTELDTQNKLITEEVYQSMPSIFVVKKYGNKPGKVVLTFDDGPDPEYTPRILSILEKEHVPASFFMIGINAENNIPLVKRIFNSGYEIGNHTFTHPNMADVNRRRAVLELNATRLLLECITGHTTILFRAPFNADSEPETMQELIPVALSKEYNYLTIGESIDPNDWEPNSTADSIFVRVVRQRENGNIILLHDAGGNRNPTIEALPRIIKYFKSRGDTFTTIGDLINEKKENLMPKVPKSKGYYLIQLNYYTAEFGFWGGRVLFALFIVCIILSVARILILAYFATKEYIKEKKENIPPLPGSPLVSIIVPAYNEEVNAVKAVANLLSSNYGNFNIIFVDDGSKDTTYKIVSEAFASNPKVKVYTKENGGKASALNYGISVSEGEYVLCIDADTNLLPNALELLVRHFADENVGAVAGNVKVGNEVNILTKWQSIEYITSQNFDRNAFANVNAITVVPGAIGIFRKAAIEDAGGFTSDTFAEDCDLTIRILKAGYVIKNENKAIALTEAPETLRMFLKQRFRWTFGVMQSFWKNRDALFNAQYKTLGWVALPNILIFQILIPVIAPLADFFMVIGILTGYGGLIFKYYALFMLIDVAVAILAFYFEKENIRKLIWLIPQRLVYRWLMLYILYKSIRRAIKGELQSWGVLKRTGNIQENPRLKTFKY